MKLEVFIEYLREHEDEIKRGEPFKIQVVDRDIFEEKVVEAIVVESAEAMPDGEDLWIKDEKEVLGPVPWKIKIIREMPDLLTRQSPGLGLGG